MTRMALLSNGELCVTLNECGLVDRLFFPYVGSELHTADARHRIGVWAEGKISWLDDSDWQFKISYPYDALVSHTVATNQQMGVLLELEDFIDAEKNCLMRNIHIVNMRHEQRSIRLFLHQAFVISNRRQAQDTAQFLPEDKAILHYGDRRAFVASAKNDIGQPFDQYSVGLFGDGLDGTWRDAEDGQLSGCDVDCGQVDSTIGFSLTIGGLSSRRVYYCLAAGISIKSAVSVQRSMQKTGTLSRLEKTVGWWRKWLAPSLRLVDKLEPRYRQPFLENLMLLRAHIDRRGAIISRLDQSPAYCRPREAAYAVWPLVRLGYKEDIMRFLAFCRNSVSVSGGYLLPNYHPDGSAGSTNRGYTGDMPPIQSDVTALVLFVFAQTYALHKNSKLLNEYYYSLVVPMADFLSNFVGDDGLPRPSYDFQNEKSNIYTYTVAVTQAALTAAAELADIQKDQDNSVKWRSRAEDMRLAAQSLLRDDATFFRSVDGDPADAAAFFGAFMFGLFDFHGEIMTNTFAQLTSNESGDDYRPTELWLAQYLMEIGRTDEAMQRVDSFLAHNSQPSVWRGAEVLSTLLDTLTKK